MKATDILQEEHRVILRVLQCLSAAADRAEKEGGLDVESIPKMTSSSGGSLTVVIMARKKLTSSRCASAGRGVCAGKPR